MQYLSLDKYKNGFLLVARILLVILFVLFGWQKMMGFEGTVGYMASVGAPLPQLSAIIAVIVELVFGFADCCRLFHPPTGTASGRLHRGNGYYRPSLLEHDRNGPVHGNDQFL